MNNKKKFWRSIASFLLAVLCIGFVSCGDDDDENKKGGGENSSLIQTLIANKWITRDSSYGEGSGDHAWVDVDTGILYFTSDHSGISYWTHKDYDTDLGNTTTKDYSLFEYTVSGNEITLTYEDSFTMTVYYQGGYLTTESMGTIFEPSQMTSNDYAFVKSLGPQTNTSGGITYTYDSRTYELKISGNGAMQNYSRSNQPWKDYHINKVIVDEGVTSIGDYAFYHMDNIKEIDLPNSLQKIGKQAFEQTMISEVNIPPHVEEICEAAFAGCEYLKKVYFDGGCDALVEIGDNAFLSCPINFGYFTIPKNLKKIGFFAFISSSCKSLTLNDKLESIGDGAFGTINASKIEIPNSVKSIGSQALRGSFSEIIIGTGLTTIGNAPFITSKSGKMYINLGIPLELSSYQYIIVNTNGNDAAGSWTLYVPKGSKSAYQKATGWKAFKSINEDASLTSGNGTPDNNGQGNGNGEILTGTANGHEWVDLGLSVKWATCNVGATKPGQRGDYFAWGETSKKSQYSWDTYTYYENGTCIDIGKDIARTKYDVAYMKWGGNWCMPTDKQIDELLNNTTYEETTQNKVWGLKFTAKNGRSIFLPYSGEYEGSELSTEDYRGEGFGRYWSSTLYEGWPGRACNIVINKLGGVLMQWDRYRGYSVRPVLKE